jgi:hypothetical protein
VCVGGGGVYKGFGRAAQEPGAKTKQHAFTALNAMPLNRFSSKSSLIAVLFPPVDIVHVPQGPRLSDLWLCPLLLASFDFGFQASTWLLLMPFHLHSKHTWTFPFEELTPNPTQWTLHWLGPWPPWTQCLSFKKEAKEREFWLCSQLLLPLGSIVRISETCSCLLIACPSAHPCWWLCTVACVSV